MPGLVLRPGDEQHGRRDRPQRLGAVEALERVEHGEHPRARDAGVDELALGHEPHREPLHAQRSLARSHERAAEDETSDELGPLHGEAQRDARTDRHPDEVGLPHALQLELVGDARGRGAEVEADGVLGLEALHPGGRHRTTGTVGGHEVLPRDRRLAEAVEEHERAGTGTRVGSRRHTKTLQLQSRTTLPHWPDRAVSKASSHCSAGKRWVMTWVTAARKRSDVAIICDMAYHVSYISRP